MAKVKVHKGDIAKFQLETAVRLFLTGKDRSSVITLAGAASGILGTLVRNAGKDHKKSRPDDNRSDAGQDGIRTHPAIYRFETDSPARRRLI